MRRRNIYTPRRNKISRARLSQNAEAFEVKHFGVFKKHFGLFKKDGGLSEKDGYVYKNPVAGEKARLQDSCHPFLDDTQNINPW